MKGRVAAIFLMIVGLRVGVTAGDAIDADSALGEVWSPTLAGLYGGTLCFLIGCIPSDRRPLQPASRAQGALDLAGGAGLRVDGWCDVQIGLRWASTGRYRAETGLGT